jgi:hypothetical protein
VSASASFKWSKSDDHRIGWHHSKEKEDCVFEIHPKGKDKFCLTVELPKDKKEKELLGARVEV